MSAQYKTKELKTDRQGVSKFTIDMVNLKRNIRAYRIARGYSVEDFAHQTGVTRKKYEDIEALRGYGCYVSWDYACIAADVLDVTLEQLRDEPGESDE